MKLSLRLLAAALMLGVSAISFSQALDAPNVPNEFLLFQKSGHGNGLRIKEDVGAWPERAKEWLIKASVL